MKNSAFAALSVSVALLSGCASSSSQTPPQDRGLEGDGTAIATPDSTKPYPKESFGWAVGSTVRNLAFYGYPDGQEGELKKMELADYYDPTGGETRLIHLQASGLWCGPCKAEAKAVATVTDELKSRKVVWIVSLAQGGEPGVAATHDDLNTWLKETGAPVPHFLDPGDANLGPFYKEGGIPWNCDIDAKTMKVVHMVNGSMPTAEAILRDVDKVLGELK